jgi:hypothetical protein
MRAGDGQDGAGGAGVELAEGFARRFAGRQNRVDVARLPGRELGREALLDLAYSMPSKPP